MQPWVLRCAAAQSIILGPGLYVLLYHLSNWLGVGLRGSARGCQHMFSSVLSTHSPPSEPPRWDSSSSRHPPRHLSLSSMGASNLKSRLIFPFLCRAALRGVFTLARPSKCPERPIIPPITHLPNLPVLLVSTYPTLLRTLLRRHSSFVNA